ncbi:MAG: hypothetical protein ABI681_10920 [Gemmatimonadales bacterium]
MKARPLLRLMWSPQAGFLVLPLALAAAWPAVRNHPAVAGLAAGSPGDLSSVVWGEAVSFAVVAGFLTGLITRDLLQAPFAFIVPSLRNRILTGKAIAAALIAVVLAFRLADLSGLAMSPAIAACTLLFFSIGAALSDPVFPRSLVWIIGALLVIPVWEPGHVRRFFEFAPMIGSVAAITATAVLVRRELDPDTARERTMHPMQRGKTSVDGPVASTWRAMGLARAWSGYPRTGRLWEWVRAMHYENFGARRFLWITSVLWAVGLNCGTAYALKNPSFAAVMGLMNLCMGGHRITGRWAYPIARERRALVLWLGSLVDSVAYFALAALILPLIYALHLPQVILIKGMTPRYGLLAPLAIAFITAPVVQWPRVTSNLAPAQMSRFGPLWLRVSLRCLAAVAITTFTLESLYVVRHVVSMTAAVATAAGLAIAFQRYYWINLKHHFAGSDLA